MEKHYFTNSTHVVSAEYDESKRLLIIVFKGGTYQYEEVSPKVYKDLITAESPGSYIRKMVVNKYNTGRLQ